MGRKRDCEHFMMKMKLKNGRRNTSLVKKMEFILYGMTMGRKKKKAHIEAKLELDYGHGGMKKAINGRRVAI